MEFASIATGSTGNMNLIRTDKTCIVVDLGLTWKKAKKGLEHFGIDKIDACFLTHEHGDHVAGIKTACKYVGCPIFATDGTIRGYGERKECDGSVLQPEEKISQIGDITVTAIPVYHDTYEPVGYMFEADGQRLTLITDTGRIDDNIFSAVASSDAVMLESDYEPEMLLHSTLYTQELKNRILSPNGHLSNDDTAEIISMAMDSGKLKKCMLIHGSKENNSPIVSYRKIRDALLKNGYNVDVDLLMSIADRDTPTEMIKVVD